MAEILWKVFELLVSLFECCVVIRFICLFLNNDFSSQKGKVVYVIGIIFEECQGYVLLHRLNPDVRRLQDDM